MASSGRSFPFRRQGEAMEAAESLLVGEINSVFEDAIVFLLITSANQASEFNAVEQLNMFLRQYASKQKGEAGPQAEMTGLSSGDAKDSAALLTSIDPLLQHLAAAAVRAQGDPAKCPEIIAAEMQRLVDTPEEMDAIFNGGKASAKIREANEADADNGARLN